MDKAFAHTAQYERTLYFSAITFVTVGYGDFQPANLLTRIFSASEGFIGVTLIVLFSVTLSNKISR